ncbi:putative aldehyde reductase [Aspergillus pseudonomiae]|uniref:Putative aldehyde reductase n=1 Tax=Aspergillus pseudonomiae TaxID=1506151 RepID=A0A5N7DAS9_9EURO|nr:putative aldehyde reductase [Aspergillus pseudonomiae]KAB8258829.1 putative aldehyde reductase [Aspergillus pseudonomiae]KAE8403339.1 putative aldehyde reductase [Aspergillus pseudonomiae]
MSTPTQVVIPKDAWMLVTGANGYIGSTVVNTLLELGYKVRGTVRAPKPWLDEFFVSKYGNGRYESVVVPRLDDVGELEKAFQGIEGVAHVASDLAMNPKPNEVIPGVVSATIGILEAARRVKSVKRVVLTSSSLACYTTQPDVEGIVIDEGSWNDAAIAAAWDEKTPQAQKPIAVYAASKTEGERAAWKWMAEHNPSFKFNTIVTSANFGTILHPQIHGSSMGQTAKLLEGDPTILHLPPVWFIDVIDTAKLHAIGLLDPNVQSQRLFGFAQPFAWDDIIAILRRLRPDNDKIPDPLDHTRDLSKIVPASRAEELLKAFFGKGWTYLEESLAEGIVGK